MGRDELSQTYVELLATTATPETGASPPLSVTWISPVQLGHQAIMLKHKLRKSRKNILSLLEFHEEDEKRENVPEYSEIKKTGRKDKKKKGIRYTLEPILE